MHVTGVVQGVGFRPWACARAESLRLAGFVRNTSAGVDIHLEGEDEPIDAFIAALSTDPPPLAAIDAVQVTPCEPTSLGDFRILDSEPDPASYLPVAPDVATCAACLAEMWNPADRRYRYPFINCTSCGPRFTIQRDIPYDRATTTMAAFAMCQLCRAEYENPSDRRFHAQPTACAVCGPRLQLELAGNVAACGDDALCAARSLLTEGRIIAVKGLGGYHLCCDATSARAVARLRAAKRREGKPFALMASDSAAVQHHAVLDATGRRLLESPARPVVLLGRRSGSAIASAVAPGRGQLGFMLPYTPLQHLLLERADAFPEVLVMTSANLSDEPIAYRDDDARERLVPLADALLLHDRGIATRTDDSVVAVFGGHAYPIRRSRGYAPLPIRLPCSGPSVLAAGAEMKNAFCLTRDDRAFLSHHIGEMSHFEALRSFEEGLDHFARLFRITPHIVAHDLHPDYVVSRTVLERAARLGLPSVGVQHHHAHIASCMADNGLEMDRRVIGVGLDGTGFGTDGAIWGGEFLVAGYADFERCAHLRYVPLPGGNAATRKPYRMALAWLRAANVAWTGDLPPVRAAAPVELGIVERQLETGINAPQTSSAGRLFDAFASLTGVCHEISYEAQAAAELEALARTVQSVPAGYPFDIDADGPGGSIDPTPAVRAAVEDIRRRESAAVMALRFHQGLATMIARVCVRTAGRFGLRDVALSGGVWQNILLLVMTKTLLEQAHLRVLVHRQVPANDGGLALGQACVALARIRCGSEAKPTESGRSREVME